jgi:hypothetical protein
MAEPRVTKATLRRVGKAALSGLSDAEIAADPAGAMNLAQSGMRGVIAFLQPPAGRAPAFDPGRSGLAVLYRLGETNHCPGCGGRNWHIGRETAECGRCATALPLAPQGARL